MNSDNLVRHLPYISDQDNVFFLEDGTIFTGLKVSGIDAQALTDEEILNIKIKIKSILKDMPNGMTFQLFHKYVQTNGHLESPQWREWEDPRPVSSALRNSYTQHELNHVLYKQTLIEMYLIFPKLNDVRSWFQIKLSSFIYNKNSRLHDVDQNRYKQLIEVTYRVQYSLKTILGIESELMDVHQLVATLRMLLNPDYKQNEKCISNQNQNQVYSELLTIRERVSFSHIEEFKDHLKIGDRFIATLRLAVPGLATRVSQTEKFLNEINFPFYWSMNVRKIDSNRIKRNLEARQRRKHAFTASLDNPSVDLSHSKSEIEMALSDQQNLGFDWQECSFSFSVSDSNLSALRAKIETLKSTFSQFQDCVLEENRCRQLAAFLEMLPGLSYRNEKSFLFSTFNIADLLPLSEAPNGTEDVICHLSTIRNTPFQFSLFSHEFKNWNQVVVGKIGSGKSFIINYILNQTLMTMDRPQVMILDLGQSFKRTTELWGGDYLTIDLDAPDCGLNPLPPRDFMLGNDKVELGLLDFTVQLLILMLKITDANQLHARMIRKALMETYTLNSNPILQNLYETLQHPELFAKDDVDKNLCLEISKYLEDFISDGVFARLFNRQSTLNPKSDFFCFDFKSAGQNPRLREIATYIIGGYILRKMVENPLPKFVIFDEFSSTMSHETGSYLCEMITRNCRKHGVAFIAISQRTDDFISNKVGQTLFKQANFKWFLQIDDNLTHEQEYLKLTTKDIANIKQLENKKGEFAEVYLVYDKQKSHLRLKPDPLIYWTCTTDPRDKNLLSAYYQFFTLPNAALIQVDFQNVLILDDEIQDAESILKQIESNPLLYTLQQISKRYPKGINTYKIDSDPIVVLKQQIESKLNSTPEVCCA